MLLKLDEHLHPNLDRHQTLEGLRILAVDDNHDTLELLTFILEGHGVQVITASSASAAFKLIKQHSFDVLLCDLAMPEQDGYWLIRQVRNLPPEKGGLICAIALTAIAGEAEHRNSLEAGFNIHLTKPIEPNKLVAVVNKLAAHCQ
jgi:CheY-like chemotaxis protein